MVENEKILWEKSKKSRVKGIGINSGDWGTGCSIKGST